MTVLYFYNQLHNVINHYLALAMSLMNKITGVYSGFYILWLVNRFKSTGLRSLLQTSEWFPECCS